MPNRSVKPSWKDTANRSCQHDEDVQQAALFPSAADLGVTLNPDCAGGGGALNLFGEKDVTGTWTHTVPVVAGPHADVNTSVRSTALMVNVVYAPLEAQRCYLRMATVRRKFR